MVLTVSMGQAPQFFYGEVTEVSDEEIEAAKAALYELMNNKGTEAGVITMTTADGHDVFFPLRHVIGISLLLVQEKKEKETIREQ